MYSPPPDEAAEALARDPPSTPSRRQKDSWKTPPPKLGAAARARPSRRSNPSGALRELRTYGVWLAHIDAKLGGLARRLRVVLRRPSRLAATSARLQVRVASSRAAAAAWRTPGDAWTDDQTFAPRRKSRRALATTTVWRTPHRRRRSERPPRAQASRFAFAVVRSEAARASPSTTAGSGAGRARRRPRPSTCSARWARSCCASRPARRSSPRRR